MANNIKRPREADIDDPTGEFDQIPRLKENLTFSSLLVGLRMMGAQFPNNEKTLRREKVLRVFKMNTVHYDNAMFLDDYLCQLCYHGIYFQTRQLIDPNVYWSVIPNIGSILKGLTQVQDQNFCRPCNVDEQTKSSYQQTSPTRISLKDRSSRVG